MRRKFLRVKHDDGTWRSHYQNTNAISTYLWLRYPDKYYIYKYEIFREVALVLEADDVPRRDGLAESMLAGYRMYDELARRFAGTANLPLCWMLLWKNPATLTPNGKR